MMMLQNLYIYFVLLCTLSLPQHQNHISRIHIRTHTHLEKDEHKCVQRATISHTIIIFRFQPACIRKRRHVRDQRYLLFMLMDMDELDMQRQRDIDTENQQQQQISPLSVYTSLLRNPKQTYTHIHTHSRI